MTARTLNATAPPRSFRVLRWADIARGSAALALSVIWVVAVAVPLVIYDLGHCYGCLAGALAALLLAVALAMAAARFAPPPSIGIDADVLRVPLTIPVLALAYPRSAIRLADIVAVHTDAGGRLRLTLAGGRVRKLPMVEGQDALAELLEGTRGGEADGARGRS